MSKQARIPPSNQRGRIHNTKQHKRDNRHDKRKNCWAYPDPFTLFWCALSTHPFCQLLDRIQVFSTHRLVLLAPAIVKTQNVRNSRTAAPTNTLQEGVRCPSHGYRPTEREKLLLCTTVCSQFQASQTNSFAPHSFPPWASGTDISRSARSLFPAFVSKYRPRPLKNTPEASLFSTAPPDRNPHWPHPPPFAVGDSRAGSIPTTRRCEYLKAACNHQRVRRSAHAASAGYKPEYR